MNGGGTELFSIYPLSSQPEKPRVVHVRGAILSYLQRNVQILFGKNVQKILPRSHLQRIFIDVHSPKFALTTRPYDWSYWPVQSYTPYMAPSLREMIYHACRIPGIQPKIDKQILIQKSAAHPRLKKTARGGTKMARKYNRTSRVGDTLEPY